VEVDVAVVGVAVVADKVVAVRVLFLDNRS
jgi:hypothetical protein